MNERRQCKRYTNSLPATVEAIMTDGKKLFKVETKDISAESAFIYTKELPFLSGGTRFILNLTIPSDSINELTNLKSFIEFEGGMVRSTPEGMAISCDRECQIMTLRGANNEIENVEKKKRTRFYTNAKPEKAMNMLWA